MGSGFAKKKKEARLLQQKFQEMQEKLKETLVTGTAGGGLVEVTLNGESEMVKIKIKPECVDPEDVEGLEDLVKAAYTEAQKKVTDMSEDAMPGMPGAGFGNFGF
jgi:nucleoid-associated protein EbfC